MHTKNFAVVVALTALGVSAGALAQGTVPERISFNARMTDTSGLPVSGTHSVVFGLFDTDVGGAALWTETQSSVSFSADGLAYAELGSSTPLTSTLLDGRRLFLELTVDGAVMSPRIPIVSVPYALRATTAVEAGRLGTLTPGDVQRRLTGTCPTGQAIRDVAADGTVTCQAIGAGDITSVVTSSGSGLQGGALAGDADLGLLTCSNTQILRYSGMGGWGCSADNNTTYSASSPIGLSGTTFGLNGCPASNVLKSNGAAWVCSSDNDTTYTGTAPISVVGTVISLAGCSAGQIREWNGSSWVCTNPPGFTACNWVVNTNAVATTTVSAMCPAGKYAASGGCDAAGVAPIRFHRPFGPPGNGAAPGLGWNCEYSASAVGHTSYALCCAYH